MASLSSLRKKLHKRSSSKPYPLAMASGPTPPNYPKISLIFSVLLIFFAVLNFGISSNMWAKLNFASVSPAIYSIEVVNEFPHDPQAFTQGLVYAENDTIFESTGLNGRSSVQKVALQTGKVEVIQRMDDSDFGEGLTLIGKRLFQVTWLMKTGFIYDQYNLSKFTKFTHQMTDGWGLATDGKVMFGSDGTSTLYKIDPRTLKVIDKRVVKFNGYEVHNLNELEFIKGEVWANVWELSLFVIVQQATDCIVRISHEDGSGLGWILPRTLREELTRKGYYIHQLKNGNSPTIHLGIDVLNGIAWDSGKNRIFVTGKFWPKLYEIKLHPVKKQYRPGVIEQSCLSAPNNFGRS